MLGRAIGVDAITVVAMSAGAAMIGSAFGPTNPFQAGIALKLAQLPPLAAGPLRLTAFVAAVALWIAWTMRHAARTRVHDRDRERVVATGTVRQRLVLLVALAPMAAYVYGVLRFDWGFNELAGAFLVGGLAAGLIGGFDLAETIGVYVEGMQALLTCRPPDRRRAQRSRSCSKTDA